MTTQHVYPHDARLGTQLEPSSSTVRSGIKEYLVVTALLMDPDRWVDADHQRNGWLLVARYYFAAAAIITAFVIAVGISVR